MLQAASKLRRTPRSAMKANEICNHSDTLLLVALAPLGFGFGVSFLVL